MKAERFILFLLFLMPAALLAQRTMLDSLKEKALVAKDDSSRIKWMVEALNIYNYEGSPEALPYAYEIVKAANKTGKPRLMANARMAVGAAYLFKDSAAEALAWFEKAYPLVMTTREAKLKYNYYNLTGLCYSSLHRLPEAINAYLSCLDALQEMHSENLLAAVYINLSNIYTETSDTAKAYEMARKSLEAAEAGLARVAQQQDTLSAGNADMHTELSLKKTDLQRSKALALLSLAQISNIRGNYTAAIRFTEMVKEVSKALKDPHLDAQILQVLAGAYDHPEGNYSLALTYYNQSLEIARSKEDKENIIFALLSIGKLKAGTGNYAEAVRDQSEALILARGQGNLRNELNILEQLSENYRHLQNYRMADSFFRTYTALRDSVNSTEQQKTFVRNEEHHAYQQKHLSDSLQQAVEKRVLAYKMQRQRGILFGIIAVLLCLGTAGFMLHRIRRVRSEESMKAAFSRKVAEVEMLALRAQMNPHFIFNCLNSINRYILKSDAVTASNYLTKFARLMRLILDNSAEATTTLENERQLLLLYAEMEALRFSNRFEYTIEVDEGLQPESVHIPSMIIQPYVENAIWHGLMHKEGSGLLRVHCSKAGAGMLQVVIEDNGVGRSKAGELKSRNSLKQKSYGMKITGDRLQIVNQLYNVEASVQIEDLKDGDGAGIGTRVILHIPYKTATAEAHLT